MSAAPGITVLIPFRNEAAHLPVIIEAMEQQQVDINYVEILWIDDASEDDGAAIVLQATMRNKHWKCLQRQGSPGKKSAIHTGVVAAKYEYILTTDADCRMGAHWIHHAREAAQTNPDAEMWVMPLLVSAEPGVWTRLQHAESLQLVALASITSAVHIPVLCSGANLLFRKSFYTMSYGKRDDLHLASGDDMFLLQQAMRVHFMADSQNTVTTRPCIDFHALLQQRLRWFGKVRHLKRLYFFAVGMVVGLWQFALYLWPLTIVLYQGSWRAFLIFAIIKLIIDMNLQRSIAKKLGQPYRAGDSFFFSLLYPLFQLLLLVMSIFIQPVWKGRLVGR